MPQIVMGAGMEGQATGVLALGAHAEGNRTRATGVAAHAEGFATGANGNYSHAEGNGSSTSNDNAHAEGNTTVASGVNSHAQGLNATASGTTAHAEGSGTLASGNVSHAEGFNSTASGFVTHAEGYLSEANGTYSSAGGWSTYANKVGQWARSGVAPGAIAAQRSQTSIYTCGLQTTSTAAQPLSLDGTTALTLTGQSTNQLIIPLYSTYHFNLTLVTRRIGVATASQGWVYSGIIARDSGACRIVGTITQVGSWNDAAIGIVSITANSTSQYLSIIVTPATAVQMSWHGVLTVNELTVAS